MRSSRSDDREAPEASRVLAEGFMASVAARLAPASELPELGFELEVVSEDLSGAALWHDGAIFYVSAFAAVVGG